MIVFSRLIYFCLCCALLLSLQARLDANVSGFGLYSRTWCDSSDLTVARDFMFTLILCFPVVLTMGLFPQVNTALVYTLEQVDIQIFGGNAASSLQSSVYCVCRSVFAVVVQDPLPKKLRSTVNARLKNDAIVCCLAAVVVFLVHQSDSFVEGHPKLDVVLWSIAGITGFLLHYLLPHLRKQTPWQCFSSPLLPSQEHSQFVVRAAARVMWFERALLWLAILERSVLYPLIFLSAVTLDRRVFESSFGLWGGSVVMAVTMLKCLRTAFSDCSKQYLVLTLALLLFQYNPATGGLDSLATASRSSPILLDYWLAAILMLKL